MKANPNIVGVFAPLHIAILQYVQHRFPETLAVLDELLAAPDIDLKVKDLAQKEPLYYAYYNRHSGNRLPDSFDMSEVIKRFSDKGITFP